MINRRKMLHYVGAQDVAVAAGKNLQPIDGPVRALGRPVGVAVGDEQAFEAGLNDVAQRVVHDPIAEADGADLALLRVLDVEMNIRARTIGAGQQLLPEVGQLLLRPILEAGDAGRAPLAARRLAPGAHQVFPGTEVREGGADHPL